MPKTTTLLILLLTFVTCVLIFIAIRNDNALKGADIVKTPTPIPTIKPFAVLGFSPDILDVPSFKTKIMDVDIVIDTKGKPVFGAQLELSYDTGVISNIEVVKPQGSFFGDDAIVSLSSVDKTQGRISYAVSLPTDTEEKVGSGSVVTLRITINKNSKVRNTSITFLPKSVVTTLQTPSTVLDLATPLTLIVSSSASLKTPN